MKKILSSYLWLLPLTLILVLALSLVYGATLSAPPLSWDDDYNIWKNPYLVLGPWWGVWKNSHYGMYIPITTSFWALLYHLGDATPEIFRIANLVLHFINSLLVGLLLQNGLKHFRSLPKDRIPWPAIFGAFFFALHPLQVATVAWISGTRDLLSAFFALSSTYLYLTRSRPSHAWIATGLFAAGLLSKPNIAPLPLLLILADWAILRKSPARSLRLGAPWLLLSLTSILITLSIQSEVIHPDTPLAFRPVVALDSFGFFIRKIVWPTGLSADYGRTPSLLYRDPALLLGSIPLTAGAISTLLFLGARRREFLPVWGWFLLLLPVSGIVPFAYQSISTVADHYHYLPLSMVAFLLSLGIESALSQDVHGQRIQEHFGRLFRWILTPIATLLLVGYSALSHERASIWTNDRVFFENMAESNPNSYSAAIALGSQSCEKSQDFERGLNWLEQGLRQRPFDPVAIGNQAYCLYRMGRYENVLAMKNLFLNPVFVAQSQNQDFATASLLASIGSAATQQGNAEEGLLFTCLAAEKITFEPSYRKNIEVIRGLLLNQGRNLDCAQVLAPHAGQDLITVINSTIRPNSKN